MIGNHRTEGKNNTPEPQYLSLGVEARLKREKSDQDITMESFFQDPSFKDFCHFKDSILKEKLEFKKEIKKVLELKELKRNPSQEEFFHDCWSEIEKQTNNSSELEEFFQDLFLKDYSLENNSKLEKEVLKCIEEKSELEVKRLELIEENKRLKKERPELIEEGLSLEKGILELIEEESKLEKKILKLIEEKSNSEKEKLELIEKKSRLEKRILELKKRELWRKYTTFMIMVPFTALFAFELQALCTDSVLLNLIIGGLSHSITPFVALSLVCALYLISNNKEIKKKEQELEIIKNGKSIEEENNTPVDKDDILNYGDAIAITLCLLLSITSELLSQELIGNMGFLVSNLVGFGISYDFYYSENNKINKQINGQPSEKNSDIQAAKFMLAGSSMLLFKRVLLMGFPSILGSTAVGSAIIPALGLIGMICFMSGYALTINSYKSKLTDIKVNKSAMGVSCNTSTSKPCSSYGTVMV